MFVMRMLVLGGTRFVGRAIVDDGIARGWAVTMLNRGVTGSVPAGVELVRADRTDRRAFDDAVAGRQWDFVVDTWDGPPEVATDNALSLTGHVPGYAYISSVSVYRWGLHVDESSPVVDVSSVVDASSGGADYAASKRGAELGILASFPDALLARAGLILGPHEDIGRLPWWLNRIAAGGRVVAPGAPDRPLQYVDARDAASFVLSGLERGAVGPHDVASRSGHASMSELLTACIDTVRSDAELVWIDEARLAAAGAQPWTHLPCWVPPSGEFAGFLEADTSKAVAAGLVCRPAASTVRDTWAWIRREGMPAHRPDRPVHGLPPEIEKELLS